MSVANYITVLRLLISPFFLFIYLFHSTLGMSQIALPYTLLVLLLFVELTDACDGYFARKYNQVTDLGKILDPMADSIARITVFLTFTQPPVSIPIPFIFIFLYRDSAVSTLRTICALRGFALAARKSGKIKAAIQAFAAFVIVLLMIPHSQGEITTEKLQYLSAWIVAFAGLYTLYSGFDYVYANRKYIAKLLEIPKAKVFAARSKAYFNQIYQQRRRRFTHDN